MAWAVKHLSEREAVFAKTDLLAAALASDILTSAAFWIYPFL